MNRLYGFVGPTKSRGPTPSKCDGLGHACRGTWEIARLYRLALNDKLPSDEFTRLIYTLKEIRACREAEILTDVQDRLDLLSRELDRRNGHGIPHQPTLPRG